MKRLTLLTALLCMAAFAAAPTTAIGTTTCTITPVGVDGYFNPGDLNPPYFFVGESNEHATCTGGSWYEVTELMVENAAGNLVPEHCGNQGSVCYRLRPPAQTFWAAGSKNWCTVTNPPNDPTNDYGAPCSFRSVVQDPCNIPMKLTITTFDAATLLPTNAASSPWICKTG